MTGMTYPNVAVLTYGYGTANGINDACSRIESVIDSVIDSVNSGDVPVSGNVRLCECGVC